MTATNNNDSPSAPADKSAPTPGPWMGYEDMVTDRDGNVIANMSGDAIQYRGGDESANARLMAAAPTLLHELGAIADHLKHEQTVRIDAGSAWAHRIAAAIARAEGQ
jgi:hypothetical protein